MNRIATITLAVLALALPVVAQDVPPPPAEPNAGTHVQFTGSYTFDGGQATVAGVTVPISNRFALVQVNAIVPRTSGGDLTFHTLELEYGRNLAELFNKNGSDQVSLRRFFVAGSAGAGSVRNAQGPGNASFAFSVAGRLTFRLNENTAIDLVNVRYWRSRIATVFGRQDGDLQAGAQIRLSF